MKRNEEIPGANREALHNTEEGVRTLSSIKEEILKSIKNDNVVDLANLLSTQPKTILKSLTNARAHAIHIAAREGAIKCFKYLVEDKHIPPLLSFDKGSIPLHYASEAGHLNIIEYLTTTIKFNVDYKNQEGNTALHFATSNGHTEIVKKLIELKANTDTRNEDGCRALHIAANKGFTEIVEELIKAGADVNVVVKDFGVTSAPAGLYGHTKNAQILMKAGSNSNANEGIGIRPLHLAALNNHIEIAQILLKAGANVNVVDYDNNTAINYAALNNNLNYFKLLLEYGGHYTLETKLEGPFNDWLRAAELMNNICLLKPIQNHAAFNLVDKDELKSFTQNCITHFLIKNGVTNDYMKQLEEICKYLDKDLSTCLLSSAYKLLNNCNIDLEMLESSLIHILEDDLGQVPYSYLLKVDFSKGKFEEEKKLLEFYERNSTFTTPGNYLLYCLQTKAEVLNDLMLNREDIVELVALVAEEKNTVLPMALKQQLNTMIDNYKTTITFLGYNIDLRILEINLKHIIENNFEPLPSYLLNKCSYQLEGREVEELLDFYKSIPGFSIPGNYLLYCLQTESVKENVSLLNYVMGIREDIVKLVEFIMEEKGIVLPAAFKKQLNTVMDNYKTQQSNIELLIDCKDLENSKDLHGSKTFEDKDLILKNDKDHTDTLGDTATSHTDF